MTLNQFKILNETEQDGFVMKHGLYVINYIQGDFMCDVYKMNGFFVKFCYDLTSDKKPSINAFSDSINLTLYKYELPALSIN